MMDPLDEVLIEVQRLQILAFIARNGHRAVSFSTTWDLAVWLRVPVPECSALVRELVEEGFVEPPVPVPPVNDPLCAPLRLTPVGMGMLAWERARSSPHPDAARSPGHSPPPPSF